MKKKKTNKKPIIKTSNRGRPQKLFVSKKPKIKREGPGRPRKEITDSEIKIRTIPEENKRKDGIILILFVFSILLFGFSIYVAQNKRNENTNITPNITTTSQYETGTNSQNNISNNTSANIIIDDNTQTTNSNLTSLENQVIEAFYSNINSQKINDAYTYVDNKLRQSEVFKTYFSTKRLMRFVNNLNETKIQYYIKNIQNGPTSTVDYTITYQLKDGNLYTEQRSALLIPKDNTYKIAKLMCQSTGCSKLPFFNPTKYNIK